MMKMSKQFGKLMAGLSGLMILGCLTNGAWAGECAYVTNTTTSGQAVYTFTVPSTIALTGSEAAGTVLWSSSGIVADKGVSTTCPGGAGSSGIISIWNGSTSTTQGSYNVFPTNVPGVGFAITYNIITAGLRGYPNNMDGIGPNNGKNGALATLKFVKTSTAYFTGTSAATNASSDLATWYVGTNKLRLANFQVSNATTFTKPDGGDGGGVTTCIMRNVFVDLSSVKAGSFRSIGAKGPVVSDFFTSVDVTCPSSARTAKLSFSSTTAVAASPGILRASGGSTVQGIGIILMRDDGVSPIRFGQQFSVDLAAVGSNKVGSFPFSAAMIKISDPVVPGTLSGAVVVTLSVT